MFAEENRIIKKITLALVLFFTWGTAIASHCPADAKAIDAGLSKATLSDEVRAQVTALRDKGMSEHNSGDHGAAEKSLAEAMRLLLINME